MFRFKYIFNVHISLFIRKMYGKRNDVKKKPFLNPERSDGTVNHILCFQIH